MAKDRNGRSQPAVNRRLIASQPSWFIPPPWGWEHPVTGRHGWHPPPSLITFGQYVKRGRYMSDMTQQALADASDVDQPLISRLERGLAPATKIEVVVRLSEALGRDFPFGYCPHEHYCEWQPAPPPRKADDRPLTHGRALTPEESEAWLKLILGSAED